MKQIACKRPHIKKLMVTPCHSEDATKTEIMAIIEPNCFLAGR